MTNNGPDDTEDLGQVPGVPLAPEFNSGSVDVGLRAMRARLLDLTARNRLLNFKHSAKSTLRFVDAPVADVFERLIDGDALTIEEVPDPPEQSPSGPLFAGGQGPTVKPTAAEFARTLGWSASHDLDDVRGRPSDKLRTLHYSDPLDSIYRRIGSAARTAIEESGTNMLYLIFGFLEWFESDDSNEPRLAPLVTVPVTLERSASRNGRATLERSGDDVAPNLSLIERLKRDFGLEVPAWDEEEQLPRFFGRLKQVVDRKVRWRVRSQMTLSLLSFGKLLMYRDLDPTVWPDIRRHQIVSDLFEGRKSEVAFHATEHTFDDDQPPAVTAPDVVLDADSSQLSALVDAIEGRNFVIEGPPGTGKSQTIANLIAAAIADGKTVLFVSEKLAALQVVRRRLDQVGLGLFCLELHSHKSRKDGLLRDVQARIEASRSFASPRGLLAHANKLGRIKDKLRRYVRLLQHRHEPLDCSLFQLVWRRERLRSQAAETATQLEGIRLVGADSLERHDLDRIESNLMLYGRHLEAVLRRWSTPSSHPWAWMRKTISYEESMRMQGALTEIASHSAKLAAVAAGLRREYELDCGQTIELLDATLERLSAIPSPPESCDLQLLDACRDEDVVSAIRLVTDQVRRWRSCQDSIEAMTTDGGRALQAAGVDETTTSALRALATVSQQLTNCNDVEMYRGRLGSLRNALRLASAAYEEIAVVAVWPEPCALKAARSLAVCVELSAAAPIADLHLRSAVFEAPGIAGLIEEAASQAVAHSKVWASLDADFDMGLARSTGVAALRSSASTLASASLWNRWFSRSYREAVSFYRLMSRRDDRRRRRDIARVLLEIAAAVEAREEFVSNTRYSSALQHLFRGLETDWAALRRVAEWYGKVGEAVHEPEVTSDTVKAALLASPPDRVARIARQAGALTEQRQRLQGLPGIVEQLQAEGFNAKDSLIAEAELSVNATLGGIGDALDVLTALKLSTEVSFDAIPGLLRLAGEQRSIADQLRANEKVKAAVRSDDLTQADLDALMSAVLFAERIRQVGLPHKLVQRLLSPICFGELAVLRQQVAECQEAIHGIRDTARTIEDLSGYGGWGLRSADPVSLESQASALLEAFDELATWSQWLTARASVCSDGLESLISLFERKEAPVHGLLPGFQLAYHHNLIRALLWELRDSLLSGLDHEEMRTQFRAADQEGIRLARARVAAQAAQRPVPAGQQTGPIRQWTDLALINNEISKQRRHIPIRQLVLRAGKGLQALKPCFLMGPLSVAQYLPPGGLAFDLVVMDEASQLKPEDAIGALARGGQMVVVGDPQQLPPTNFFQRVLGDEDEDDEERTVASEGSSILDVASAVYQPIRRLRWHYRSRHESLIAFSNREFYDGKLLICPSAYDSHPQLGVRYRVTRGVYENRKNPIEAAAVAEAVVQHVKARTGESLGVVALNFEQAELLEEVIERRLKDEPEAGACLGLMAEKREPFFVKNLENVQGDERDVIFVSCTYGPDARGNQFQRFGPVNTADGHRRLNVLFTRAKRRCEVFSSLDPDKIHDEGVARGVRVFKQYLKYAQTGRMDSFVQVDGGGPESDFEACVGDLLRREGHQVVPQIGVSGFRIDIGIRNPAKPGAYILGVECDGAAYHSGRSARDRDRLRQEILESQGWKIHRIWSTDWFHSRQKEVDRLLTRVQQALESDPDVRDLRAREQRRESMRAQLESLREEIAREHPDTPADRRLLRSELFDLFMTKRPTTQQDWFRIPLPLRERTDPTQVRLYLPRILTMFREATQ
jgi:very-short-patch-repair endonuclease